MVPRSSSYNNNITPMNPLRTKKEIFLDWTIDLLIYIVILNLFAQYSDDIYFETFTYSIAAAVVLKALLVIIIKFEHVVANFWKKFEGKIFNTISVVSALRVFFSANLLSSK